MASLKRLEFYIVNPVTGLPVADALVEIRKQGATVSGIVDAQTYNVNNPGGVVTAAETVSVYQPGGAVRDAAGRGVSSVTATQIIVAAPGFSGVADDDRISPSTNLPTIYEDAEGAESKANPLTTDANGFAYCWVPGNFYDAKVTKAGVLTERLLIDQAPVGMGQETSNAFGTGTQTVYDYDTVRTLASGDNLARYKHAGAAKFTLTKDGRLTLAENLVAVAGTFTGLISGSAGLTISAGALTLPAGSIESADLEANAVHKAASTALGGSANVAVGTSETARVSVAHTGATGNVGGLVTAFAHYSIEAVSGATGKLEVRLYIGGALKDIWTETVINLPAAGTDHRRHTARIVWFEPALATGSTTYEIRDIKTVDSGTFNATYLGFDMGAGQIKVNEFKK